MRTVLIIAMIAGLAVGAALAQSDEQQQQTGTKEQSRTYLYKWIDSKGVAHVTDDLSKVPKKYRDKAAVVEQQQREEGPVQEQQREIGPSSDEQRIEEDKKAEWQQRMKDTRQRLVDAQRRYDDLGRKRNELLGAWGGVSSGHLETQEEANRIDKQMKHVQQEIDDARNQIETVIPDEARKAGIPPGWLRE